MTYEEIMSIGAGEVVPGGYSVAVNATYIGPGEKLLNKDGSIAPGGHAISKWDPIVVLDISYSTQLALIQYPAGGQIRQGYIHNSLSHIEYKNLEQNFWQNGSTPETVYYSYTGDASYPTPIPAHDKAIFLYKVEGRYNVAYWTNKGAYTCAGFVNYSGGITPAVTNGRRVAGANASVNDIPAGGIVPGGRTYPANAISHQNQAITDVKGNVTGHSVSDGDELTVLDISYSRQRALVQYQAGSDIRQGYIVNDPRFIVYKNPYTWVNGSTAEVVYSDIECTKEFGTIDPYEAATVLYKKDGKTMVVYDAPKADTSEMEMLNKNGFVRFPGNAPQATPSAGELLNKSFGSNVEKIPYGTSPLGHPLNVYKIGSGSNVLFANFAIHGFEDDWDHDGTALITIGNQLIEKFAATGDLHGWTVYVNPCANPDGTFNGITNDGPGRCTVESRIDMNRCFPAGFEARLNSRNYVGYTPLGAAEAVALKDIVEKIHSEHINGSNKMVLVDFHGWMGMTQGNQEIGKYFNAQFNGDVYSTMAGGFFSTWAQDSLSNTRAVLVEYPKNTRSIAECINDNYSGRTYDAFMNLLSSEPGNGGSSGTSGSDNGHINSGVKYVNVRQEPNTTSTILGQLYGNNPIQILAKVKPNGDTYYWYKIVFIKDGEKLQAYVREDFVTVTGEIPKDDTPAAGGEPGNLMPYDSVGQVNNKASSVHVRKGAGTGEGCDIITSVNSGELLMIIGKTQPGGQTMPWYEINLNGQELYIRSDFVNIISETKMQEEGTVASTSTDYAHVRYLPGTGSECATLDTLYNGTKVEILGKLQPQGQSLPWYRVKYAVKDGSTKIGFIRTDLVRDSGIVKPNSGINNKYIEIIKNLGFNTNQSLKSGMLKQITSSQGISFEATAIVLNEKLSGSDILTVSNGNVTNIKTTIDKMKLSYGKQTLESLVQTLDDGLMKLEISDYGDITIFINTIDNGIQNYETLKINLHCVSDINTWERVLKGIKAIPMNSTSFIQTNSFYEAPTMLIGEDDGNFLLFEIIMMATTVAITRGEEILDVKEEFMESLPEYVEEVLNDAKDEIAENTVNIENVSESIIDEAETVIDDELKKAQTYINKNFSAKIRGKINKITIVRDSTDLTNQEKQGMGVNGITYDNPTIKATLDEDIQNAINKGMMTGKQAGKYYIEKSRYGLTDEWAREQLKGDSQSYIDGVCKELGTLRKMMERTRSGADFEENIEENSNEPWRVDNCAEVWGIRNAIMNGVKFENIIMKTVKFNTLEIAPACKNCEVTLKELIDAFRVIEE